VEYRRGEGGVSKGVRPGAESRLFRMLDTDFREFSFYDVRE
jgi:hypothetical protein